LENNPVVCIISSPRSMASVVPLSNFVDIQSKIFDSLYLITGNEGRRVLDTHNHIRGCSFMYTPGQNIFGRIWGHLILELKIAFKILQINANTNIYIFFMGEGIILPTIIAKAMRKPVLMALAGSSINILKKNKDFYSKPFELMEYINYWLADRLVVYSPDLIDEWGLKRFKKKISIAHEHYLDFERFNTNNNLSNRDTLVGFFGRLSGEKGIINFIKAIPQILNVTNNISFMVGGDGQLKNEVEKYLDENKLDSKVKMLGWVSQDDLPGYLNQLKLLVLPSYTEGLPNIMLQAMACGTPVLATPVGAISDFIKDGFTGFIMKNNTPECITENILRALNFSSLEKITQNAWSLVQNHFTYEKTVEKYKSVLAGLVV
jgi:glycosyltransferase involved in cell wall biosynthesis